MYQLGFLPIQRQHQKLLSLPVQMITIITDMMTMYITALIPTAPLHMSPLVHMTAATATVLATTRRLPTQTPDLATQVVIQDLAGNQ